MNDLGRRECPPPLRAPQVRLESRPVHHIHVPRPFLALDEDLLRWVQAVELHLQHSEVPAERARRGFAGGEVAFFAPALVQEEQLGGQDPRNLKDVRKSY